MTGGWTPPEDRAVLLLAELGFYPRVQRPRALRGLGDGAARRFALVRRYGESVRRITRPVAGSVSVRVGGLAVAGFTVEAGGSVTLDAAPAAGAEVRASFLFDVPVRFAQDSLRVSRATFLAGEAVSVPLVEVREG